MELALPFVLVWLRLAGRGLSLCWLCVRTLGEGVLPGRFRSERLEAARRFVHGVCARERISRSRVAFARGRGPAARVR